MTAFSLSSLIEVEECNPTSLKSNIPKKMEEISSNDGVAIAKQSYVTQATAGVVVQIVDI